MIILSKGFMERLERMMESGFVVELSQVGNDVRVTKHPVNEANIHITPVLASLEEEAILTMALKTNDGPIVLPDVRLPEAYWILGILGSRNQPESSIKKRLGKGE